jgi:hypothetical protein
MLNGIPEAECLTSSTLDTPSMQEESKQLLEMLEELF